jgi:hypothetical protein
MQANATSTRTTAVEARPKIKRVVPATSWTNFRFLESKLSVRGMTSCLCIRETDITLALNREPLEQVERW